MAKISEKEIEAANKQLEATQLTNQLINVLLRKAVEDGNQSKADAEAIRRVLLEIADGDMSQQSEMIDALNQLVVIAEESKQEAGDDSDDIKGLLLTIADNGGGMAFVFGNAVEDWQGTDFQHHPISLSVGGGNAAENFLGEMRCVPAEAVADLVNHLAARGHELAAGDFVSTGAATVPQPFVAGDSVKADFGSLGVIELQF